MSDTLERPLAGYCHHGQVVGLTIDATGLADFIARYERVATVEDRATARALPWCATCIDQGDAA